MTNITASMVRELREKSGAGMMECKKALEATSGDMEAAFDELRKAGLKTAAKKAGRETGEGRVFAKMSDDGRCGAMVSIACETDFVAKTPDFHAHREALGAHAQLGYLMSGLFEPAFRYELVDPDSPGHEQVLSLALSLYPFKHNFKWQTDGSVLMTDAGGGAGSKK